MRECCSYGSVRGRGRQAPAYSEGRKGIGMAFGHEKLDVYRAAIEYVGWAYRFCKTFCRCAVR